MVVEGKEIKVAVKGTKSEKKKNAKEFLVRYAMRLAHDRPDGPTPIKKEPEILERNVFIRWQ